MLRCPRCGDLRLLAEDTPEETVVCSGCSTALKVPRRSSPAPGEEPPKVAAPAPLTALGEQANPFAEDTLRSGHQPIETENPYQASVEPSASHKPSPRLRFVGGDPRLASHGKRLAGALIDWAVFLMPFFCLGPLQLLGMSREAANVAVACAAGVVFALQATFITARGQSLGKIVFAMQIVGDDTDRLPGFWRGVVLRNVVPGFFPFLPLIGGLLWIADPLFILFGSDRQCLHDIMAGTKVLDRRLIEIFAQRFAEAEGRRVVYPWER